MKCSVEHKFRFFHMTNHDIVDVSEQLLNGSWNSAGIMARFFFLENTCRLHKNGNYLCVNDFQQYCPQLSENWLGEEQQTPYK